MANIAYLPIIADRYGAMVRHVFVVGLDLTNILMRAQVRVSGDAPGTPLVDLSTVSNGNAQGLRLVEVTMDDGGLPTSHIEIVINETTLEGLPYTGEVGDPTQLAWDWQIVIGGRKRRLARGEFEITGDGVTGADAAPVGRSIAARPRAPIANVWSSARLTFGEDQVTVTIEGADLIAPLANQAQAAAAAAAASKDSANLAAAAASAAGRYFATRAAGEAGSATDQLFSTDDGAGSLIYYRRTAGGSAEIGRAVTPGALGGDAGSSLVGFKGPGVGAGRRPASAKMGDFISAKDFGAIGDGQPLKLNTVFPSLAAAQARYPFVTSLDQFMDSVGLQAALNYANEDPYKRRTARLPCGYYVFSESIGVPSWITLEGESRHGTVIYQQVVPLNAPVFVNQDPVALVGANLRRMTVLGGTHMLKINVQGQGAEQAAMVIESISSALQSAGQIEANMLQTTVVRDCDLANGDFGIKVSGICNANDLYTCRIVSHAGPALYARGVVGRLAMYGGSMEAGGNNTAAAIDIDGGDAVTFSGVYFENAHKTLLRSRNSKGIDFSGCRFVGVDLGQGLEAFRFDTADDIVSFGSNTWFHDTSGPQKMVIAGHNDHLGGRRSTVSTARSARRGSLTTPAITFPGSVTINALRFDRPNKNARNSVAGEVRIQVQGLAQNGLSTIKVVTFQIAVKGVLGSATTVQWAMMGQLDDNSGIFVVPQQAAQDDLGTTFQLVVYGANANDEASISATFDFQTDTSDDANNILVTAPWVPVP